MSMTFSTMAMHSTLWGASNAGDPLSTQGNWGGGSIWVLPAPSQAPQKEGPVLGCNLGQLD